jgi:hypothetical protein
MSTNVSCEAGGREERVAEEGEERMAAEGLEWHASLKEEHESFVTMW